MKIYSDKTPEVCKMLLLTNIREYSITRRCLRPGFSLKNEFLGQVKNDRFWLKKTRRRLIGNPLARVYKGIFYTENGKTVIDGEFHFPFLPLLITYIIIFLGAAIILLCTMQQGYSIEEILNRLKILGIFYAIALLSLFLNMKFYKKEEHKKENAVTALLNKLFRQSE